MQQHSWSDPGPDDAKDGTRVRVRALCDSFTAIPWFRQIKNHQLRRLGATGIVTRARVLPGGGDPQPVIPWVLHDKALVPYLDSEIEPSDEIKDALDTVTAQIDPDGPAQRESYRAEIEKIYKAAGVEAIYMEPLPNGYCHKPCCLNKPWFRVTSKIGHVVIGWRKRVISIDWKDSTVKESGEQISADNVTRWETGIHAWSVETAVEYIKRLHGLV